MYIVILNQTINPAIVTQHESLEDAVLSLREIENSENIDNATLCEGVEPIYWACWSHSDGVMYEKVKSSAPDMWWVNG